MDIQNFTFGDLLKGYRVRAGISQQELASALGRHRNTITAWETGGHPKYRDYILQLKIELDLSKYETDLLLHTASYPLEYGSLIVASPDVGSPSRRNMVRSDGSAVGEVYGYLFVMRAEKVVGSYELSGDRLVIGRHLRECDIVIPGEYTRTSRKHAEIVHDRGDIYIMDLTSKHGTFVDGERVTERQPLHPGQLILLGARFPRETVCVLEFSLEPVKTDD